MTNELIQILEKTVSSGKKFEKILSHGIFIGYCNNLWIIQCCLCKILFVQWQIKSLNIYFKFRRNHVSRKDVLNDSNLTDVCVCWLARADAKLVLRSHFCRHFIVSMLLSPYHYCVVTLNLVISMRNIKVCRSLATRLFILRTQTHTQVLIWPWKKNCGRTLKKEKKLYEIMNHQFLFGFQIKTSSNQRSTIWNMPPLPTIPNSSKPFLMSYHIREIHPSLVWPPVFSWRINWRAKMSRWSWSSRPDGCSCRKTQEHMSRKTWVETWIW
jgi:hypothetical protein